MDENNERGSALIAANIIKDFRDQHRKNIWLFLNELDKEKYKKLINSVIDFKQFVSVHNMEAERFLNEVTEVLESSSARETHSLFFIDPYGYTQYSQENLKSLLKLKNADYLIFIPTNSIYRFKRAEGNPACQFVLDLGIEESTLESTNNIDSFVIQLTEILKKMADTEFGYNYELKNKNATNSLFHLFFVTKHIRGAAKFLEAKNKIKKEFETQLTFLDIEEPKKEEFIRSFLSQPKTNRELYDEAIKRGYLPKEINPVLKNLENEGNLKIEDDFQRRKCAYYLKEMPDKTTSLMLKP